MKKKIFTSIGLMSGTSMDGVDLSVIKSDGNDQFCCIYNTYKEFDNELYKQLISLRDKINNSKDLKTHLEENDNIDSLMEIFQASNWYERECYDLFGIKFNNHPDLRRIMTDYNFEGFPLRKDFPLTGHTEVRYDDVEKKVVYEPVKLTQEYRDFDYTSPWEGMSKGIDDHNEQE